MSKEVLSVIIVKLTSVVVLQNPTLGEVRDLLGFGIKLYCNVSDTKDGIDEQDTLDLSAILLETKAGQCSTWEDLFATLSDSQYKAYISDSVLSGHTDNAVRQYCAMGLKDIIINYTSIENHKTRSIREFKEHMPELVIESNIDRDMTRCFAVVNGIVPRPVVFENSLYLIDGAKMCWGNDPTHHASISLIDTAAAGGYSVVKMSECDIRGFAKRDKISRYSDINIKLPQQHTLDKITPIVVVGNKLLFPDEVRTYGKNNIIINPNKINIESALLQRKVSMDDYLYGTNITTCLAAEHYWEKLGSKDLDDECFIILLKTPNVDVKRSTTRKVIASKYLKANSVMDGILVDKRTRSILDYKAVHFQSCDGVYVARPEEMFKIQGSDGKYYSTPKVQFGAEKSSVHLNCPEQTEYEVVHLIVN